MLFSTLEPRLHFTVTLDPQTKALTWTGSGSDDVFSIYIEGKYVVTIENSRTAKFKHVSMLIANGRGGNDLVGVGKNVLFPTILSGQDGDDTLTGGSGNDLFFGGPGNNQIDGYSGADRVSYARLDSNISLSLKVTNRILSGTATADDQADTLENIEVINGTDFNDEVHATGVGINPSGYLLGDLYGPGHEKKIKALGRDERIPAILAGAGNDDFTFTGAVGVRYFGQAGDDEFTCAVDPNAQRPFGWIDYIDGGADTDTQTVSGQFGALPGYNIPNAGSVFNRLYPEIENAILNGASFGGSFWGNGLNNVITSTNSPMSIHGDVGNDQITVSTPGKLISVSGGAGDDVIAGSNAADSLYGDAGNDQINGNGGDDVIDDQFGSNALVGDDGNDTITGYNSNITGGAGNDTIRSTGGPDGRILRFEGNDGNDLFFVRDHLVSRVFGGSGNDRARIDEGHDQLDSVETIL